jgi:hypothetical protein
MPPPPAAVTLSLLGAPAAARCDDETLHSAAYPWEHLGLLSSYDCAALRLPLPLPSAADDLLPLPVPSKADEIHHLPLQSAADELLLLPLPSPADKLHPLPLP